MFRSRFPQRNVCTIKLEMKNNYDLKFQIFHKRSIVFFTIYGYTTNSQQDQLPTGLKAQLVKLRSRVQFPLRHYFHSCFSKLCI